MKIDWLQNNSLIINGIPYSGQELLEWAQVKGENPGIIGETAAFLIQWLNPGETIGSKTSGTTAEASLVQLPKNGMISSALRTLSYLEVPNGSDTLLCVSPKFIAGKMMIVRALVGGLDLKFSEPSSLPVLPNGHVSFTAIVPLQLYEVLKNPETEFRWQNVEKIIVGGGAVGHVQRNKLMEWPNEVYETYGMTETLSHIALKRLSGQGQSTHFKTLPGIKIKTDERGCLVAIDAAQPGKEIVSNDLVQLISEDKFIFIGRYDNIINSGGIKFSPEDLESKISGAIKGDYIITGIPDPKFGEKLVLLIEGNEQAHPKIDELKKQLSSRLNSITMPKEILFADAFVRTETGKINRKKTVEALTLQ